MRSTPASFPFSLENFIADQAAQDQRLKLFFSSTEPYGGGSSCSLSFPAFFDSLSDQLGISSTIASVTVGDQAPRCNQRANKCIMQGETSYDQIGSSSSIVQPVSDVGNEEYHKLSVCTDQITDTNEDHETDESNSDRSVKWTPSTMKLMQTNQPDQVPENIPITSKFQTARREDQNRETNTKETSSSSLTIANKKSCSGVSGVRVCSDCSTSTTPLWRSGPRGPKSLCNACGIRQRKARRSLAEDAAAGAVATGLGVGTSGTATTTAAGSTNSTIPLMSKGKEKKSRRNHNFIVSSRKKGKLIITDDITNTSEPSKDYNSSNKDIYDFKQVAASFPPSVLFPLDVEEAAILLMDLSSGAI